MATRRTNDAMTGVERIGNILRRKPVDRIGVFEHFWGDTHKAWCEAGHMKPDESFEDHFGFDVQLCWTFNMVADLDYEPEVVEEDEERQLIRDGNGALLRRSKVQDTTPEHVDFRVTDRAAWEEYVKPFLTPDRRRINFEGYRQAKRAAAEAGRFFCWGGVNVFELMHPVCGHQYMLMGMAMDPGWVADMVETYARTTVELMEILFAEEGTPDGVWFYEDLGFKEHPFVSLEDYRTFIQPGHKKTMDYAHGQGLPVVMHSCGMVEPLVPGMLESGIDCLQVIEVKAGMDLLQLYADYGDALSFMGGIDVRTLYTNDRSVIDSELEAKLPVVKGKYGYVLHSDHSIPNQVAYENYRYFVERGLELGTYQ
jgi:uroporphyrinogen decarboxylase